MDNARLITDSVFMKYSLSSKDKDELLNIIYPIIEHKEFKRRLTNEFLHHSDVTLGEHIIEDATVTYLLCKKKNRKKSKVNVHLAVIIAMFHDLYTIPWQNNKKNTKVKRFSNKHGFRHPIEAVINSYTWYPQYFVDYNDAKVIIDGIIHHMFPLPVTVLSLKSENVCELRNFELFEKIPINLKTEMINSSKRKKIFNLSFTRSKYIEGRIMSKADKKVSFRQIKNLNSATALLTGHNKSIDINDK